ncbi:hypothetical protein RSAG8_05212, partial [Rhizoctonia solani AG-8 WAC10335]
MDKRATSRAFACASGHVRASSQTVYPTPDAASRRPSSRITECWIRSTPYLSSCACSVSFNPTGANAGSNAPAAEYPPDQLNDYVDSSYSPGWLDTRSRTMNFF